MRPIKANQIGNGWLIARVLLAGKRFNADYPPDAPAYQGGFSHSHEFRTNPYGRKGRGRARETEAAHAYESEDQSASGVRAGMRVRHAQFGFGNVIAVEEHNDDMK
jgi:hypothetical protein